MAFSVENNCDIASFKTIEHRHCIVKIVELFDLLVKLSSQLHS